MKNVLFFMNFLKNNIVLPKNATKATNATLYQNMRFWAPEPKTRILGFRRNEYEQMVTFFWKEFRGVRGGRQHYSADFRPIGRNFDPDMVVTHKSKIQKIRFFSIFSKFVLDDSRYQIRLPNHSRTPKMSFSGHISIFWTISATLRKIVFWAKNHDFCQIWQITIWYGIWPELAKKLINFENVFSRSLRYF